MALPQEAGAPEATESEFGPQMDTSMVNSGSKPIAYPSEYFAHTKVKPRVSIPKTVAPVRDLRDSLLGFIKRGNRPLNLAKAFLYHLLNYGFVISTDHWSSFGVTIANEGEKVNPFVVVEVEEDPTMFVESSNPYMETASAEDDMWMLIFFLSIYRLGTARHSTHVIKILRPLNAKMKKECKSAVLLGPWLEAIPTWANDLGFCKIVSALDMFFFKYPDHQFAPLRIATAASRYRDCEALKSVILMTKLFHTLIRGLDWIFIKEISDDANRVLKRGKEINKINTYSFYCSGLGISLHGPYSASQNPSFCTFVNIVAALQGHSRGRNKIMLEPPNLPEIVANAELANCGLCGGNFVESVTSAEYGLQIGGPRHQGQQLLEILEANHSQVEEAELIVENTGDCVLPRYTCAEPWFRFRQSNPEEREKEVRLFSKTAVQEMTEVRQGTVGAFLKNLCVDAEMHNRGESD